jgi:hypothetical protein
MGTYQYRIWGFGHDRGLGHPLTPDLRPLSFGGVPFLVGGPFTQADYGEPWWFVFYTNNPGEPYRFLGNGAAFFGSMLPIDYSDASN